MTDPIATLFIDGEWVPSSSGETRTVICPAASSRIWALESSGQHVIPSGMGDPWLAEQVRGPPDHVGLCADPLYMDRVVGAVVGIVVTPCVCDRPGGLRRARGELGGSDVEPSRVVPFPGRQGGLKRCDGGSLNRDPPGPVCDALTAALTLPDDLRGVGLRGHGLCSCDLVKTL